MAVVTVVALGACTGTDSGQVELVKAQAPPKSTTTTRPPDCAEMLSPAAQAGQLLMLMTSSPLGATEALTAGRIGGFGLKGSQSSEVASQVATATENAVIEPFVAADEEGGTVQRLSTALGRLSSARKLGQGTVQDASATWTEHVAAMKQLGFNMNFAPVADVGSGSGLGSRSFGDDPATVSQFVNASVAAHVAGDVMPVVKHWPGIGSGSADPHAQLTTLAPLTELRTKDLVPFVDAFSKGAPAVMVTHAEVPGLTEPGVPASLSRAALTGELRGAEGFSGLIITDSLGMGPIVANSSQAEAAEKAISAGADIALLSGSDVVTEAHTQLTAAITEGRIPEQQVTDSVRRVLDAKGISGPCIDVVSQYAAQQRQSTECADAGTETTTTDGSEPTTDCSGATANSSGNSDSNGTGP